ncbi:MAG: hypothetical protein JSR20_14740 [Nitrospira sp.]|nr:hypothetical protein [Nitrospira sp.]
MHSNKITPNNIDLRSYILGQDTEHKEAPFPSVPLPLLERLEALFPNRIPSPNDSDREIWLKTGRAEVVSL